MERLRDGTGARRTHPRLVISFRGVGKSYRPLFRPAIRALDEFTLEIAAGEVMGIAGPNGAGKSTLIALLLGYRYPSQGVVRIDGMAPRAYIERHGIGYLSELVTINPRWRTDHVLRRYALLAGVPAAELTARVEGAIARLGIAEHRLKKVKALSKGNLQRLGLAQALLREERILVLDEPTHGLDPVWTQRFRDIVNDLRRPDRVIIIASHNLDELQRLADRVAIVDRGRLQRMVDTGHVASGAPAAYRLVLASGAQHVEAVFPGGTLVGRGEYEVRVPDLSALNAGIAQLISRGAVLSAVSPTHSALEQQFREAVGETTG